MVNIFMKYGLIIVGIVFIILLVKFTSDTLHNDTFKEQPFSQEFSGTNVEVKEKIIDLCNYCVTRENVTKPCFVLNTKITEGAIENGTYNNIIFPKLYSKSYTLKIINNNSYCRVVVVE